MLTLAVGIAVGLLVALAGRWGAFGLSRAHTPAENDSGAVQGILEAQRNHAAAIESLQARYAQVEAWVEDVNIAVAEGIKHVDRAENRIKATVRRAREKLDDAGLDGGALDAEAQHLYDGDGRGSPGPRLLEMPARVADDDSAPAPFPGAFTVADLKRIRGA